jgi:hypothetical protein
MAYATVLTLLQMLGTVADLAFLNVRDPAGIVGLNWRLVSPILCGASDWVLTEASVDAGICCTPGSLRYGPGLLHARESSMAHLQGTTRRCIRVSLPTAKLAPPSVSDSSTVCVSTLTPMP